MNQTTAWYYDHHKPGTFTKQQALCDAVRRTECNLEGQKLKSQDTFSAIQGNPFTIRLLALDESIEHFNEIKSITKEIEGIFNEQLIRNKMVAMSGN